MTTDTREVSLDIWDWTAPSQDLVLFEKWAADFRKAGGTRLEISVSWKTLEPEPGRLDLTWLRQRADICKKHDLGMRLRINSYYAGQIPAWYKGDIWLDKDLKSVSAGPLPSINDDTFWAHYGPMCTAIARELRGQDVFYNAFIGVHAELKYADWWTFDASSLRLWREAISARPRPEWLSRVVGDADLPTTPTVPQMTDGKPDTSTASMAFIAFREWTWRRAVQRFLAALHEGDPNARMSTPLGESYRRQSADFSNLDYWGLSRGSSQVVHSYDFFLHPGKTPLWHIAATISSFRGITQLPVCFEFDSPETISKHGYDEKIQKAVALTAMQSGAGLKFANFSGCAPLPSSYPVIAYAGQLASSDVQTTLPRGRKSETVLLFFSKWTTYCYRERSEWLHDAQFGWWKLMFDLGIPTRVICEDNLGEDLSGYKGIVRTYSPDETIPAADLKALKALKLPSVTDVVKAQIPSFELRDSRSETPTDVKPGPVIIGQAMGWCYLNAADPAAWKARAERVLRQAGMQ